MASVTPAVGGKKGVFRCIAMPGFGESGFWGVWGRMLHGELNSGMGYWVRLPKLLK